VLPAADVVMLIGARLNWLLSHGKGKTWAARTTRAGAARSSSRSTSRRQEADSNVRIDAPVVGDGRVGSCCFRFVVRKSNPVGRNRRPTGLNAINEKKTANIAKMAETLAKNPSPMNFHSALARGARHSSGPPRRDVRQRGRQCARLHAPASSTCTSLGNASTSAPA